MGFVVVVVAVVAFGGGGGWVDGGALAEYTTY